MPDRRATVAPVRIVQGARGVQEEQVVLVAVAGEPEVPHPRVGQLQHQPFTPAAAMLPMKARWNATNKTSTGTVIIEA